MRKSSDTADFLMFCFCTEERASKLAEFRERINLLSEELEGLAGSKLLKEESFLVRFLFFFHPLIIR